MKPEDAKRATMERAPQSRQGMPTQLRIFIDVYEAHLALYDRAAIKKARNPCWITSGPDDYDERRRLQQFPQQ